MTVLIDKAILFISLFLFYLLGSSTLIGIIPILIVISFSCLLSYFEKDSIRIAATITYIILSIFLPDLMLFLPLICYDLILTRQQWICATSIFPILLNFDDTTRYSTLICFLFFILTYLIKYKTQQIERQKTDYIHYRDKAQEISIDLKHKNQELLDKQDYEINIATLNERNRIAMEIHDNVGHLLSSSMLQIGAILATTKDSTAQKSLETVNATLSTAMDSIRNSVHNIHDETLQLEPQIQSLVTNFTYLPIELDYAIVQNPNTKIVYAIISIVKEALSNIIKHSNASKVALTIREHPAMYQIIIHDNGINEKFDLSTSGIGIKNMEKRVEDLKGIIHIGTENGFRIFISIPKGEKS